MIVRQVTWPDGAQCLWHRGLLTASDREFQEIARVSDYHEANLFKYVKYGNLNFVGPRRPEERQSKPRPETCCFVFRIPHSRSVRTRD